MSMEHKAFIFDTRLFSVELLPVLEECVPGNDVGALKAFVSSHLNGAKSPYSGEALETDWESELGVGDILEVADFAMTCYYSPEDDRGLGETWDALLETLRKIRSKSLDVDVAVLGTPLRIGSLDLDPGRMGTGFVQAEDIAGFRDNLESLRGEVLGAELPDGQDLLYEISREELVEAHDYLIELYSDAAEGGGGLLFTF